MSRRHQNSPEHHHRFICLKSALDDLRSSTAMALSSRMEKCGDRDYWNGRYTCRSPACPACRDRYIAAQRRQMTKRFGQIPVEQLGLFSVILGGTRQVEETGPIMDKARRDARNMVDAARRNSGLWGPVQMAAWLEMDAFAVENFAHLGPDRRALIEKFLQIYDGEEGVAWVPSLHGIVHLGPGLDIGQAQEVFERQWPGRSRVDLRPFHAARSVVASVGNIVNYANKCACTTDYYDAENGEITSCEWETSWLVAYYTWLHEWSRGFHRTRISVGPKKIKLPVVDQIEDVDDAKVEVEPMPFVHGFSGFHTDYYYWRY